MLSILNTDRCWDLISQITQIISHLKLVGHNFERLKIEIS